MVEGDSKMAATAASTAPKAWSASGRAMQDGKATPFDSELTSRLGNAVGTCHMKKMVPRTMIAKSTFFCFRFHIYSSRHSIFPNPDLWCIRECSENRISPTRVVPGLTSKRLTRMKTTKTADSDQLFVRDLQETFISYFIYINKGI